MTMFHLESIISNKKSMALLYKTLSGAEFNQVYHNTNLYKFLYNSLKHYDFEYKLGLNIDHNNFNPINKCSKGGLYFCDESNCYKHFGSYGTKIGFVQIPDDAKIYVEDGKFKADKLIITKIVEFTDMSNEFWIDITMKNGLALQYVLNPTYELQKMAVTQNPFAIQFVLNQTEELCTIAIRENGRVLRYITNPSDNICKLAVQRDGYAIQDVERSMITQDILELAIKQNPHVLSYVVDMPDILTEDLIKMAVKKLGISIIYVRNPSEELACLAVGQNGRNLRHISNQTEKICEIALQQHGNALRYVNPRIITMDLCKTAVKQNGYALQYVKLFSNILEKPNELDEISELAIKQKPSALQLVLNQTDRLCKLAVELDGTTLYMVKEQTLEICRIAVKQNDKAMMYVDPRFKDLLDLDSTDSTDSTDSDSNSDTDSDHTSNLKRDNPYAFDLKY